MFVSQEEIRMAHDLLLPGKPDFDEDKVKVIQSNESCDVKACPGSGKTTVLLAKLSILSNRLPFEDGSGICVLTHTNVAIDEIKARFGGKAELLFSYPNFCGTIQEFVDRFLTIPFFNSFSPKPLLTIDDDRALPLIRNAFYEKSYLERSTLNHLFREDKEYKSACSGGEWDCVNQKRVSLVESVFVQFCPKKFYRTYGNDKSIASEDPKNPSATYLFLNDVRLSAIREGILKYEDAFSVALAYCSVMPGVREALSKRFKYVFIDEAQDTSDLQIKVLENVLDSSKTVVQRYGDDCQSIYDNEKECAWKPENILSLSESLRFGEPIANVLRSVCIEDNKSLSGNSDVHSAKPVILVYNNPQVVLHSFAELVRETEVDGRTVADIAMAEKNQDPLHRINIKAVGFVGKEKWSDGEFHSIHRYYPQFNKKTIATKPFGESVTLSTLLQKNVGLETPQGYRTHILDALVVTLERADIRRIDGHRFNQTSMVTFLEENRPELLNLLNLKISDWVLRITKSENMLNSDVFDSVKEFILGEFAKTFGFSTSASSLNQFLQKDASCSVIGNIEKRGNIFTDGELEIEVNTVHSVKGETHAATLFLETKYHKYESEHFGAQICGESYKRRKGDSHVATSLKVAYVAMSRPRYLLAYAMHKDRFDRLDREKIEMLWDVRMLTE